MNNDVINARLKHLGSSIDKVRDDVGELKTDVRETRQEIHEQSEHVRHLEKSCAADHVQIETNKTNIRDLRALIWKIVAILAAGGYAVDHFFN